MKLIIKIFIASLIGLLIKVFFIYLDKGLFSEIFFVTSIISLFSLISYYLPVILDWSNWELIIKSLIEKHSIHNIFLGPDNKQVSNILKMDGAESSSNIHDTGLTLEEAITTNQINDAMDAFCGKPVERTLREELVSFNFNEIPFFSIEEYYDNLTSEDKNQVIAKCLAWESRSNAHIHFQTIISRMIDRLDQGSDMRTYQQLSRTDRMYLDKVIRIRYRLVDVKTYEHFIEEKEQKDLIVREILRRLRAEYVNSEETVKLSNVIYGRYKSRIASDQFYWDRKRIEGNIIRQVKLMKDK